VDYIVDRGVDPSRPPATGLVDPWTLLSFNTPRADAPVRACVDACAPDAVLPGSVHYRNRLPNTPSIEPSGVVYFHVTVHARLKES
jgi:hypothetical protein